MARLFFDTAASRFHGDKKTGEEPRAVRISWWRDTDEAPFCRLIRPSTNMTIAPETLPYHGLTVERLERDGLPPEGVIAELEKAALGVLTIGAFNAGFHWRSLYRLMGRDPKSTPIPTTAVCVMKLADPICNIPATCGQGTKPPNLREACERFGILWPGAAGGKDPMEYGCAVVRAVRAIYEACVTEIDKT